MVNIFQKKVLILAIYAGEIMMKNGAEVYRVEDTIHRILKHSGIARADVFVVTTGIVATIADASLPPLTLVKRVENRATNLNRIYQVNNVSGRRRNDWIGLLIRHYTDSGRNVLAMRQRRDFLR